MDLVTHWPQVCQTELGNIAPVQGSTLEILADGSFRLTLADPSFVEWVEIHARPQLERVLKISMPPQERGAVVLAVTPILPKKEISHGPI